MIGKNYEAYRFVPPISEEVVTAAEEGERLEGFGVPDEDENVAEADTLRDELVGGKEASLEMRTWLK